MLQLVHHIVYGHGRTKEPFIATDNSPDCHGVVDAARADDGDGELAHTFGHGTGHGVELDDGLVLGQSRGQRTQIRSFGVLVDHIVDLYFTFPVERAFG